MQPLALKPPVFKQGANEQAMKIYAAFLCALIILVVASRRVYEFHSRNEGSNASFGPGHAVQNACLRGFRVLNKRTSWKWMGQPSYGLVLIVVVYLVANIILSTTILAAPNQVNHWASRFGWLTAANMALCVFFGVKNTPLASVTAVSHEKLNIFHRIVGYTAVFALILHAILYSVRLGIQDNLVKLITDPRDLAGLGAGIAMLILLMGYFRHRNYELFYSSHISGFIATMVLAYLHRPSWFKKLPHVLLFTSSMWMLDRVIRAAKMAYNLVNNQVTFHPLPDGGTRLLLKKPGPETAFPGSHCYLWVPRIHPYETHPFTIVNNGPQGLELVMKAHEGFTRAVSNFAIQNPGYAAWGSIDGPYGSLPDTENYDKLILIAGGSGAAFTFGLMNRILNQREKAKEQSIDFIWAVKRTEHLRWFDEHLFHLTKGGQDVNPKIFITDEGESSTDRGRCVSHAETSSSVATALLSKQTSMGYETISEVNSGPRGEDAACLTFAKMDVRLVIHEAMLSVPRTGRILIAACGPKSLMDAIKDSADIQRNESGYRIDVYCEEFGGG